MRIQYPAAVLSYLLIAGCVSDTEQTLAAEIRSDPSILIMSQGESELVIVEAFVGNEPESVRWNIGTLGNGLQVVEDSTYGTIFVGNQLVLPAESHARRYEVTMNGTVATSFVISGGTGVITIPVRPPTP